MSRTIFTTLAVGVVVLSTSSAWAQTSSLNNSNVQGTGAAGATLSSRFNSDPSRFTGGSTGATGVVGAGTTQAGIATPLGAAGGAGGNLGNTGLGGFGGGLGGFGGGLGGFGGGLGGFGGGFGGFGRGGFGNFGQQGQQGQQGQGQIRTRMVLGFKSTLPATRVIATRTQDRLNRTTRIRKAAPISVVMEGHVAILEGTVGSEHDRKLAGRLVSFEPGVRIA